MGEELNQKDWIEFEKITENKLRSLSTIENISIPINDENKIEDDFNQSNENENTWILPFDPWESILVPFEPNPLFYSKYEGKNIFSSL